MANIGEQLENLHKRACSALEPLTLMITRRRYSSSIMEKVTDELEQAVDAMENFWRENKKP